VSAATEAGKAAELVGFALQPKIARGADERYSELWSDYRTDEAFRDVVDAVANGLGLVVIDAPDQGLIVTPMEKSAFTFRLVDYQAGMDPARRLLTGLVHLGIAAVAYPREADLEDDIVVRRRPEQVERYLRDACQALADAAEHDPEAGEADAEMMAWRAYLAMPASVRSKKGGYTVHCTLGMITRAFKWLVDQGMARESAGTYQLLDRYRMQVREVAGQAALLRLRSVLDPAEALATIPDVPVPEEVVAEEDVVPEVDEEDVGVEVDEEDVAVEFEPEDVAAEEAAETVEEVAS
jgi:hypothetical protein